MRNLLRQGDTMIAVESAPAVVEFDDILGATKVVYDECVSDAPWEMCDGFEHTVVSPSRVDGDAKRMRGYCWHSGDRERVVIQLPEGEDYGLYKWHRERGASKQVAREAVAAERRRTLDLLVKWYSDGWQYWGVKCDFEVLGEEFHDSVWGIDDEDYAEREVVSEIADNVAAELEKAGFTVNSRPERVYSSRADKQARLRYNLQLQNWKD